MEKRNWKIYFEWIDGKEYDELSREFSLSVDTIKNICTSHVPDKIRQDPQLHWQRANSYKKFREWKRKQSRNGQR